MTENGKYVICASEDSCVYVWRKDDDARPSRSKSAISITQSYEYFNSQDVTAAIPWPNTTSSRPLGTSLPDRAHNLHSQSKPNNNLDSLVEASGLNSPLSPDYGDRASATWPEEKLHSSSGKHSRRSSSDLANGGDSPMRSGRLAWGMVIVTASRGGEVRVYQNFGFPAST